MRVVKTVAKNFLIADFLPDRATRRQLERIDSLYREADIKLEGGEAVVDHRLCRADIEVLRKVLLGLEDVLAGET